METTDLRPRGVKSTTILAYLGKVLDIESPVDSQKLLLSANPVDSLDVFFSHVWSSQPKSRYLGILWHLNARKSAWISVVLITVLAIITSYYADGRLWVKFEQSTKLTVHSLAAISGVALLLFSVLSLQSLRSLICFVPAQECFLDRCCIDQVDLHEKSKGINQIPHILRQTRTLVVLLSDQYFDRLWCCYEVAVFRSCMAPGKRIAVVPLRMVYLTFLMTLFDLVPTLLFRSNVRTSLSQSSDYAFAIISVAFGVTTAVLSYGFSLFWYKDQTKFMHQLSTFSLSKAMCSDTRDRVMLIRDIERRFEGIQKFEHYIQNDMIDSIGSRPRLKYLVFMSLPSVFAIIGYLCIIGQRFGLFCMSHLGDKEFHLKDDVFCVVLDRPLWVNWFVIICELIATVCYYPVVIGGVYMYSQRVTEFCAAQAGRAGWDKPLHGLGLLVVSVATVFNHMHFEDVILFHSIQSGCYLALAFGIFGVPVIREWKRKARTVIENDSNIQKPMKSE